MNATTAEIASPLAHLSADQLDRLADELDEIRDRVFADLGDEDAVASADLVAALRHLPGVAEGRWRYADLTQPRLAQLLAPYEVSTRDVTLPDGRRRKSYRRGALLAAMQSCSC